MEEEGMEGKNKDLNDNGRWNDSKWNKMMKNFGIIKIKDENLWIE